MSNPKRDAACSGLLPEPLRHLAKLTMNRCPITPQELSGCDLEDATQAHHLR